MKMMADLLSRHWRLSTVQRPLELNDDDALLAVSSLYLHPTLVTSPDANCHHRLAASIVMLQVTDPYDIAVTCTATLFDCLGSQLATTAGLVSYDGQSCLVGHRHCPQSSQ